MLSSSASPSSSPEPEVLISKSTKKGKHKKQKKNTAEVRDGKNEGVDPNWEYKPPQGALLLDNVVDAGEFDWDAINNDDDIDLWLIRIPEGVKPKYLENLKIDLPSSNSKTAKIGTLQRKHTKFDAWSLGCDDEEQICGEEIKELSWLLPRKTEKGKFYLAPKPIARHIVLAAQAAEPTPTVSSEVSPGPIVRHQNPPRQSYPKELLKHKFMPYGSMSVGHHEVEHMDVDVPDRQIGVTESVAKKAVVGTKLSAEVESKKAHGKKRKGDSGTSSPKKTKKVKTTS